MYDCEQLCFSMCISLETRLETRPNRSHYFDYAAIAHNIDIDANVYPSFKTGWARYCFKQNGAEGEL